MPSNGSAVYSGLIDRGLNAAQAAALAGNLEQESSFDPAAWNAESSAGGLAQWRGSRLAALLQFATSNGKAPSDLDTQLDFIKAEMAGSEAGNSADFLASTDVRTANVALQKYLRYGPTEGGRRLEYAQAMAQANQGTPMAKKGQIDPDVSRALSILSAPPSSSANSSASDPDVSRALSILAPPVAAPAAATPVTGPQYPTDASGMIQTGNPMARGAPKPAGAPQQSVGDELSAAFSAGVNDLPFGDKVLGALETGKAGAQNFVYGNRASPLYQPNYLTQSPQDVSASDQAQVAANPVAAAVGGAVGTILPYALVGPETIGGKVLGTATDYGLGTVGNLLARTAASAGSTGAIAYGDTLERGGTPTQAWQNGLIGVAGGALAPAIGHIIGANGAVLPKMAAGAAIGAGIGGGNALLQGASLGDAGKDAMIGAGVGAAVPFGVQAAGKIGASLISRGVSPAIADLADKAINKFDIPLGAAQISPNPLLRTANDVVNRLPLSGGTSAVAQQVTAFNKALAGEMGETASALTPDVMARARSRIGDVFDGVAQRVPVLKSDQQFESDLLKAATDAESTVDANKLTPVMKQFDNIVDTFKGGSITGEQYQSITAKNSILSKAIAQGGDVGQVASEMKDALFGLLQRNAPQDVVDDLQRARYQWKVMRTLEDPAAKSPDGEISPARLMGSVVKNFPNMAYDGAGNMGDLARIGQTFLKAPPNSGTEERSLINRLIGLGETGGSVVGGVLLAAHPELWPQVAASVGGYGLGAQVAGRSLRSRALAQTMIDHGMGNAPVASAGTNMLLRGGAALGAPTNQNAPLSIMVNGGNPFLAAAQ